MLHAVFSMLVPPVPFTEVPHFRYTAKGENFTYPETINIPVGHCLQRRRFPGKSRATLVSYTRFPLYSTTFAARLLFKR